MGRRRASVLASAVRRLAVRALYEEASPVDEIVIGKRTGRPLALLEDDVRSLVVHAGCPDAAADLEHFLDGEGEPRAMPVARLLSYQAFRGVERWHLRRFERRLRHTARSLASGELDAAEWYLESAVRVPPAGGRASLLISAGRFLIRREGPDPEITGVVNQDWAGVYDGSVVLLGRERAAVAGDLIDAGSAVPFLLRASWERHLVDGAWSQFKETPS